MREARTKILEKRPRGTGAVSPFRDSKQPTQSQSPLGNGLAALHSSFGNAAIVASYIPAPTLPEPTAYHESNQAKRDSSPAGSDSPATDSFSQTLPEVTATTPNGEDDKQQGAQSVRSSGQNSVESQAAGMAFADRAERELGLDRGYAEGKAALRMPTEGQSGNQKQEAMSKVASATEQFQADLDAKSDAIQAPEAPAPAEQPADEVPGEATPEGVQKEVESAAVPVESATIPVGEISGSGPGSSASLARLQSLGDVDESLLTLGVHIHDKVAAIRSQAAASAAQAATRLQGQSAAHQGQIEGAMAGNQAAAATTMNSSRSHVTEQKAAAYGEMDQAAADAQTAIADITNSETTRLQESIDGGVEDARKVFSDADEKVNSSAESEAGRAIRYAADLAQRARLMAREEANRYRRTEEDTDLGEDKAEAVIDVANRIASQLESDGDSLSSDVREQADTAREEITDQADSVINGMGEVDPSLVDGIVGFMDSANEGVTTVCTQGSQQLDAAETGVLGEIDKLDAASQGRGAAILAEGKASLDAALAGGLVAQTSLVAQAGMMLDDAATDTIGQVADLGESRRDVRAQAEASSSPDMGEKGGLPIGTPRDALEQHEQSTSPPDTAGIGDQVLEQLNRVGPSVDEAIQSQTDDLSKPLDEVASGTNDAGSAWVGEVQGNMEKLNGVTDTGFGQVVEGADVQVQDILGQAETKVGDQVDQVSQQVDDQVSQISSSVDSGVLDATSSLVSGVDEGNAHADEVFAELPEEMQEAAEAQESWWSSAGHWLSEQLADTWQAIEGMVDWGFVLDLLIGIAVGLLVAAFIIATFGTGTAVLLVAGAAAGAAGFAAAQMSANVRNGDPLMQNVGHAALVGGFVGLAGAAAGVLELGLLAGTGLVMLGAGIGVIIANLATGREWDDHLLATILIVGVFHAIFKGVSRLVPRSRPGTGRRGGPPEGEAVSGFAGRVVASLGQKALTVIRAAFGDAAAFNDLVRSIQGITRPTLEIVRSIRAYFDKMGYSSAPENKVALERLEAIARGELTPEQVDIDFMQHELLERALVERGISKGYEDVPGEKQVWDPAHDITRTALGVDNVYHPDAIRAAGE